MKQASCEEIFTDKISRSVSERPGLEKVENYLRAGNVLVVWRLDRLGRSLKHLISYVSKLKVYAPCLWGSSEFERNLIKERTLAGLEAARAMGRQGGRPEKLSDEQKELVKTLYANKKHSIQSISKMVGVGNTTL